MVCGVMRAVYHAVFFSTPATMTATDHPHQRFELVCEYGPMGDQPAAIDQLVRGVVHRGLLRASENSAHAEAM